MITPSSGAHLFSLGKPVKNEELEKKQTGETDGIKGIQAQLAVNLCSSDPDVFLGND
jgi:hypothetical protein